MNCAFPIPNPIAALALSHPGRLRSAELSIVSILDGKIGDPVTWIDAPGGESPVDRTSAPETGLFQAVVDDIGAHLPTGTVLVHQPDSVLALLRRILPTWRPALVVDTLSLAEYTQVSTQRQRGIFPSEADPNATVGLGATADRAIATARFSLRLIGTLGHGLLPLQL